MNIIHFSGLQIKLVLKLIITHKLTIMNEIDTFKMIFQRKTCIAYPTSLGYSDMYLSIHSISRLCNKLYRSATSSIYVKREKGEEERGREEREWKGGRERASTLGM